MLRPRHIVTAASIGLGVALAASGVPASAQTISIVFVEPVVPTQTDAAAVAERQAAVAPRSLVGLKGKAASEIAKRQRTLSELTAKITASTRDCLTNGAMLAEITGTATGLTALNQAIAAETDLTRARTQFQQIYTSFRVYLLVAPKAGKVLRCDAQLVRIDQLRTEAAQVQAIITAINPPTVESGAAQVVLNQALTALTAINPALALAGVTGLVPDRGVEAGRVANGVALKAADTALDASNRALRSVQDQLSAARKAAQRSGHDADRVRREAEQAKKKAEHEAEKARREVEQAKKKAEHDAEKARREIERGKRKSLKNDRGDDDRDDD